MTQTHANFDAVVIGYGPVGAVAAHALGGLGWRVAVVERMTEVFPLPRAAMFDGEIFRIFQGLGLGDTIKAQTAAGQGAEFIGANGKRIPGLASMEFPPDYVGPMGWPEVNFFHQPKFEQSLRAAGSAHDGVRVLLGHEVMRFAQDDASVHVDVREAEGDNTFTLRATYLIACDGSASPTRKALGIDFTDLGYDRDWLVVDMLLKRDVALPRLAQQICDPARVATFVPMCFPHRRWEFRMREGETREDMMAPNKIWELLAPWLTPDDAEIARAAVYQFHAAVAKRWREGRVFLAGDAAHQMPPFLGQGMCTGIRDIANLTWKLDMVHRGLAPERILDTYYSEREPHARDVVDFAVQVGRLMDACADPQRDPSQPPANADAAYGGGRGMPHLHDGILAPAPDGLDTAGYPLAQPRIRDAAGAAVLLDEETGARFAILSRDDITSRLTPDNAAFLEKIDALCLPLPKEREATEDIAYLLDTNDAIIVRPDRYIFGFANDKLPLNDQITALKGHFT